MTDNVYPEWRWSGLDLRRGLRVSLLLLAGITGTVSAEPLDALLGLSLDELINVKVSSPTLTPESLNRTPAAITVFTHEEIRRTGYDYLHELLNLVPGLQVSRSADGPFSVSSRGRANSSGTREILVLMDGVPRNEPFGGGASHLLDYFPLERIERVEVVRGPGSALYGENAFMGVINIITREGDNELAVQPGSHDRIHLHGLGHQDWNGWQLDGFARAEQDNGDDYKVPGTFTASRVDISDPIRNLDLGATLATEATRISTTVTRREAEDFYYGEINSDDFNEVTTDYASLHLEHKLRVIEAVDSRVLAGWQHRHNDYWLQGSAAGALAGISSPASDEPLVGNGQLATTVKEVYWRNDWSPQPDHGVQFGADWREESIDRSRLYTNYDLQQYYAQDYPVRFGGEHFFVSQLSAETQRRVLGAYLQYQQQLADATRLTLSLRHDEYSDVSSHTTPRFGLVHQLTDTHSLKLLYAEAFRAPALTESGLGQYSRLAGNPGLEHEIVKTLDAIWIFDSRTLGTTAGWFHNHYVDPISIVQNGTTRTYLNTSGDSSAGFEFTTRWQALAPLQVRATLTRLTDLPDSALREADTLGSLLVNYSHANWNFNLAAVHHSERSMLTPVAGELLTLDPYWLLSSKLLFELDGGVQWWLQVKNSLDADIETPAQGNRITEGVPNRGRELGAGVSWTW